jgi:hypothetical protein
VQADVFSESPRLKNSGGPSVGATALVPSQLVETKTIEFERRSKGRGSLA